MTDNDGRQIYIPSSADEEDFVRCMEYVQLREMGEKTTKVEIAKHFKVSRPTLDAWILKWETSGLLKKCRAVFMIPRAEEIKAAEDSVLDAWPDVLSYATGLAMGNGKSEKVAVEAMNFLNENVVKPRMEQQEESGADELGYVEATQGQPNRFDPLSLSSKVDKSDN
jgi:hypothetical protein